MDNLEYESVVENPKDVHEMLLVLGWKPEIEVKKHRKKAKMGAYELCLDRVENLGDYLEIEKLTEDTVDPAKVVSELYGMLELFGLSNKDEESRGYDTLMWQLNKKNESK
jgi:adenylate cyclase class 2